MPFCFADSMREYMAHEDCAPLGLPLNIQFLRLC